MHALYSIIIKNCKDVTFKVVIFLFLFLYISIYYNLFFIMELEPMANAKVNPNSFASFSTSRNFYRPNSSASLMSQIFYRHSTMYCLKSTHLDGISLSVESLYFIGFLVCCGHLFEVLDPFFSLSILVLWLSNAILYITHCWPQLYI